MSKLGLSTRAIHAGAEKHADGALAVPIFQTSTFIFDSAEQGGRRFALEEGGYIYTRLGNPTTATFERRMADLEGGAQAIATSSGMGAVASVFWSLLSAGDHVVTDACLYGCTFALLQHSLKRFGVEVSFVDTSDLEQVKQAMKPNTKMLYLETPANPNLKIIPLKKVIDQVRSTHPQCCVVVDNTFATPVLQRPLELGADIVLHSATKYLNGHGDVIAGVVVTKTDELADAVRWVGLKDCTGAVLGPQEAFLVIRGLKTLALRMERHCENAATVAQFLADHPKVEKVFYPGLKDHKGHQDAMSQMSNKGGAVIAFEVKGGMDAGRTLMNSVKLCSLAVSLGDTETLIEHPASMTHSPYTPEERAEGGITDGLVRLSVGLEDVQDIIDDLQQALAQI